MREELQYLSQITRKQLVSRGKTSDTVQTYYYILHYWFRKSMNKSVAQTITVSSDEDIMQQTKGFIQETRAHLDTLPYILCYTLILSSHTTTPTLSQAVLPQLFMIFEAKFPRFRVHWYKVTQYISLVCWCTNVLHTYTATDHSFRAGRCGCSDRCFFSTNLTKTCLSCFTVIRSVKRLNHKLLSVSFDDLTMQ